jgi:hypothetical protein
MISKSGIADLAETISQQGSLVAFDPIVDDPRFVAVDPP